MRHGPTRNHTRKHVDRPEVFGSVTRPEAEQDFALGAIAVDHAQRHKNRQAPHRCQV
jgi:predicted nucleotidyltransferase